jgi:hypothetical protein
MFIQEMNHPRIFVNSVGFMCVSDSLHHSISRLTIVSNMHSMRPHNHLSVHLTVAVNYKSNLKKEEISCFSVV